MFTTALNYR